MIWAKNHEFNLWNGIILATLGSNISVQQVFVGASFPKFWFELFETKISILVQYKVEILFKFRVPKTINRAAK